MSQCTRHVFCNIKWYNYSMTSITTSDISHLATLSGLSLADDETESLRADIENIISYINTLDELDVSGVEPTYQVTDLVNVMREDVVDQSGVTREQLLGLAAESVDTQIKVQKVL